MNFQGMSDAAVIAKLGGRAREERLRRNLTQATVAERAGIGTATLSRFESGNDVSLGTLIAVLRTLGALDGLDAILPAPALSPLTAGTASGEGRQRSRPKADPSPKDWVWGDDT